MSKRPGGGAQRQPSVPEYGRSAWRRGERRARTGGRRARTGWRAGLGGSRGARCCKPVAAVGTRRGAAGRRDAPALVRLGGARGVAAAASRRTTAAAARRERSPAERMTRAWAAREPEGCRERHRVHSGKTSSTPGRRACCSATPARTKTAQPSTGEGGTLDAHSRYNVEREWSRVGPRQRPRGEEVQWTLLMRCA